MLAQIVYPLLLYGLGLLPGVLLRKKVPLAFFAWTAFAWGAFLWALVSAIWLWLPFTWSVARVAMTLALAAMVAAILWRRDLEWPTGPEIRAVLIGATVFSTVVVGVAFLRPVEISSDSLYQVVLSTRWATGRFEDGVLAEFGYWGHLLPAVHAAAPAFGADYFYTLSAATGITLLASFYYFCQAGLQQLPKPIRHPGRVATFATIYLTSSFFLVFQFVYIHNNIVAALYLLIAAGSLWLAHATESKVYLGLSTLAFLAYGMTRTETALYAVVFLVAAISTRRFSRRTWLVVLLPFTVYLTVWNVLLLLLVRPDTHIMNPARLLIMIAAVLGVTVTALLAETPLLRQRVTPYLHRIMFALFVLILAVLTLRDPSWLPYTLNTFIQNILVEGIATWGLVWWVAIALTLLALPRSPRIPFERIYATGILGFVLVLTMISYEHHFRLGAGDSGNRTLTALLPIVILYLTLKTAPYLLGERPSIRSEATETQPSSA